MSNSSNIEAFKITYFNLVHFIIFIIFYFCKYDSLLFSGKYTAIQEKKRTTHKAAQLKIQNYWSTWNRKEEKYPLSLPVPQTFDFVTVMGQNYSAVQGTHPNCNAGPILRGCCSLFPWGEGEQSNVCMSQKCKQKGSEYSEIKSLSTNLQWIQLWQLMLLLRLSPLSLCQNRWQEGNIAMSHQLQMMPRRLD